MGKKKFLELEEIIERLRRESDKSSQAAIAKKYGISTAFLSDVLNGNRGPGEKLLDAMGLRPIIMAVKK